MIRSRPVLVYCDASFVPPGSAGAGYVAFHGGRIAFGGCRLHGIDDIDPAELAGAGAAVAFALDAFPEADSLLLTTDNNKVQSIPAGPSAEGFPEDHDPSGVLGLCRVRGIPHDVRWWPGHGRGAQAATFAANATHALSVLGRRRGQVSGSVEGGPGWRTRLMDAIGGRGLDGALKDEGLTLEEAMAVAGVDADTAEALVRARHLDGDPRGGITLSSAIRVRDEALRLGLSHADDESDLEDLGLAEIAFRVLPASGAIHASSGMTDALVGTCLVREGGDLIELASWARATEGGENPAHEPVCDLIDRVSEWLSASPMPGIVDLFLADTLACKAVASAYRPSPGIARAGERLDAVLAEGGMRLRVHVAKAKRFDGDGQRGVARIFQAACKLGMGMAHAGHPQSFVLPAGAGGAAGVHAEIAARNAELGLRASLAAQEAVTAAAFAAAPHEGDAIDAFAEIARVFHAEYKGYALLRWSLLPFPGEDGGMRLVKGARVKAPFGTWKAPIHLAEAWVAWCARFAALVEANPALRAMAPCGPAEEGASEPELAIAA